MRAAAPETIVAYQRLRLREIRQRYEELNPEPDHYLGVERNVSDSIDTLEVEFGEVRETLISLGVELDGEGMILAPDHPVTPMPSKPRASEPPASIDFDELLAEAGRYLAE